MGKEKLESVAGMDQRRHPDRNALPLRTSDDSGVRDDLPSIFSETTTMTEQSAAELGTI